MRNLLAPLVLSCAVAAQAYYIPSDTPTTGTCNVIPFGDTAGSSTWSNQVYQSVATAAELGNSAGLISGIAFAPCGSGVHRNTRLRVTLSHVPPAHVLSPIFANNLPNPVLVLDVTDYVWNLTANTWNEIGLQVPFAYDGVSDLVMEVVAEGNINPSPQGFHRDVLSRAYATGWSGSPPSSGTVGTGALKWCVSKCVATVSTYGEGCAGLSHSYTGVPQLGAPVLDANLTGCAPSSPAFLVIGANNGAPFPIDLSFLGLTGCRLYTDILVTVGTSASSGGTAVFPLGPVPRSPNLNCLKLYTQGANANRAAPGGLSVSNYARLLFGR